MNPFFAAAAAAALAIAGPASVQDAEMSAGQGPLPTTLTLARALAEADARSPTVTAARAAVEAAEGRARQAGYRANPELNVEVENIAGTGPYSGLNATETTVSVNQRLDFAGRRRTRLGTARAELAAQQLRLAIVRADLAREVREQFARAIIAAERLRLAQESDTRARELARIAGVLVQEGREPPLRALRARSGAAQAAAALEAARAEERAARATLASLFGLGEPMTGLSGPLLDVEPQPIDPEQSLDVRLADAELAVAESSVSQEQAARRLDPSVGLGVRHLRETGDMALVGGVTMPLPVFDRNQGNIDAALANVRAAQARRALALATSTVRARNAIAAVEAAEARVEALERAGLPEASEALRLAQLSYRAGRSSLVELLDVQSAYTNAQSALSDARLALALATAELGRVAAR